MLISHGIGILLNNSEKTIIKLNSGHQTKYVIQALEKLNKTIKWEQMQSTDLTVDSIQKSNNKSIQIQLSMLYLIFYCRRFSLIDKEQCEDMEEAITLEALLLHLME